MERKLTKAHQIEYEQFLQSIGNNIQKKRKKLGLTQENLDAEPLAINDRNLRRIEAGKRNFTMKTLFALAKKLNCNPEDLLRK